MSVICQHEFRPFDDDHVTNRCVCCRKCGLVTVDRLFGMTQGKWDRMTPAERDRFRSNENLSPQLEGLEGWRVEVVTTYGETRRFIVGRSTGWKPCHIERHNRKSTGGPAAEREYQSVRKLYRVD